jgi:hypothetical protein
MFEPQFMKCIRKLKPGMTPKRASAIIKACTKAYEKRAKAAGPGYGKRKK